jgi:hypothetical protein
MNWTPWRRRRNTPPDPGTTHTGGAAAHRRAEAGLAHQLRQQPEVSRVARSLRELREHNHFAETIAATFKEGRA